MRIYVPYGIRLPYSYHWSSVITMRKMIDTSFLSLFSFLILYLFLSQIITWPNRNCLRLNALLYPRPPPSPLKIMMNKYFLSTMASYKHGVISVASFSSTSVWSKSQDSFHHNSIQMDTIIILIHLSNITTFNVQVKHDF